MADFLVLGVLAGLLVVVVVAALGRVRLVAAAVRLAAAAVRLVVVVVRLAAAGVRLTAVVVVRLCTLLALVDRGLEAAADSRVVVAPLRGDDAGLLVLAPEDVGRVDMVLLA